MVEFSLLHNDYGAHQIRQLLLIKSKGGQNKFGHRWMSAWRTAEMCMRTCTANIGMFYCDARLQIDYRDISFGGSNVPKSIHRKIPLLSLAGWRDVTVVPLSPKVISTEMQPVVLYKTSEIPNRDTRVFSRFFLRALITFGSNENKSIPESFCEQYLTVTAESGLYTWCGSPKTRKTDS